MSNLSKKRVSAWEAGASLVPFCEVPGDPSPLDDLCHLAVNSTILLQELLFLKIFSVHQGIVHSQWQIHDKLAVGKAFIETLPWGLREYIPKSLLEGATLEELIQLSEQRCLAYSSASQAPHENGPAWQVARKFVELCNQGNWEDFSGLMLATTIQGAILKAVIEASGRIKII